MTSSTPLTEDLSPATIRIDRSSRPAAFQAPKTAPTTKTVVHLIANAHLDPVWLWNWQAGVDEALATFRSAVDRCHEYPEFRYTRGEAWLYEWVEDLDPGLFREVRALIEAGRWSIAGSQWIQPDANLPTAAGWRKQFALGQRYFQDRFGITSKIGYNVDTFGHPATLPDLLQELGYHGYVFHRPNESQVSLPAQTFRWQGSGGGEVIGFRIAPAYVTRSDDLHGQIDLSVKAADPDFGQTMMFYGLGNHGGGPTKANIEWLLEHRDAFEGVELRFSTVDDFFKEAEARRNLMPVVDYELQKTFPGCYSVMHEIKQCQHRGERLLEQAEELVRVFGTDEKSTATALTRIDEAWKDLAFTQFHDILAGTSVPSSYLSTRHMQGRATIVGEEEVVRASRRYARATLPGENVQRLVLLNGSDHDFDSYIEYEPFIDFDDWRDRWFSDENGESVPFQLITPEANTGAMTHRVVLPITIPAKGRRVLKLLDKNEVPSPAPVDLVEADGQTLRGGDLSLELTPRGIGSLRMKGRELLGADGLSLHLREDHGDTWVFHETGFNEDIVSRLDALDWIIEDDGPLRVRAFADQKLGDSKIRLAVTIHAGKPEIHLHLQVVFAERHKMLQLPIHLANAPTGWTSGLAGGHVKRKPGPDELPFCGWDSVQSTGANLSLHTPDAYSSRLHEDVWQFSLLRSPLMAWTGDNELKPAFSRRHSDQGWHDFHFILRIDEAFDALRCEQISDHQAKPPVAFDHYVGMNRPAWGNAPPRRLWTPDIPHARSLGHMKHLDAIAEHGRNWEETPE
ncbi:MAG: glycoside hydrolase family 38 C-terminal domain-containing protein [Akkermansiaceae bacterium]